MTQNGTTHVKLKVVVVGDAAVGKTSLALRFSENKFGDSYVSTVGGSFCSRSLFIANKKITFQIWDTAGTERFKSVIPFYLRNADVALIMYDITSKESFDDIQQWLRVLNESAPDTIKCTLVGNKSDLQERRQVTKQEAEAFADVHGLHFIETSAKSGQSVQKLFVDIGSLFIDIIHKPRSIPSVINVTDTHLPKREHTCC